MKKILSILLATMVIFTMVGCNKKTEGDPGAQTGDTPTKEETKEPDKKSGYELALITDIGTIDDKSFNQGSREGVEAYAKENDVTYKYYQPAEKTTDAY